MLTAHCGEVKLDDDWEECLVWWGDIPLERDSLPLPYDACGACEGWTGVDDLELVLCCWFSFVGEVMVKSELKNLRRDARVGRKMVIALVAVARGS